MALLRGDVCSTHEVFKGAFTHMKKLLTLLFAVALSISLSSFAYSQDAGTADKKADKKEAKAEKKEKKAAKKKEKKEKKEEKKGEQK